MALVCDAYTTKTLDWTTLIRLSLKAIYFTKYMVLVAICVQN